MHEKLLKQLIQIQSYSGDEKEIRTFISEWFKAKGIENWEQGDNLLVHFEGKDRSKAFILNSHMDTVSAGNDNWKYGAWKATKEGNRLVGLGASDMKSGLAASMLLAEKIHTSGLPPVDIWFTYVCREETDGSGTQEFATWFEKEGYPKKYKDMAAIFTEGTGLAQVEHGHRGNIFLEVTARGPSGHASRPDKIRQELAVSKMFSFAQALENQVELWKKEYPSKYFKPSISVGLMTSIRANLRVKDGEIRPDSPNKFADSCVATFDLRTTPETHEFIFTKAKQLGKKFDVEIGLAYPASPAGFTDPSEKIVKLAKTTGGKRKLVVSLGSADLGFLTVQGVKAVILGPGEKEQAHKLNEFCYPHKIPQAVSLYNSIIEAWAK